jgi:hypothetical protein
MLTFELIVSVAKLQVKFSSPNELRDEPIELDSLRSRSAYQAQSSRPLSGFALLGRLARQIAFRLRLMQFPPPTDCGSSRSSFGGFFSNRAILIHLD